MTSGLTVKRIYEPAATGDGMRVLVDRVWPRGISKQKAALTLWLKEVAPSTGLRRWFGHDPARWAEFSRRYHAELDANPEPVAQLKDLLRSDHVTLLYGAKDTQHNQALALAEYLRRPGRGRKRN